METNANIQIILRVPRLLVIQKNCFQLMQTNYCVFFYKTTRHIKALICLTISFIKFYINRTFEKLAA